MKTSWLKILLIMAAYTGWTNAALAAGLTVTPGTITNDFVGKITLTITGLPPGQTVVVERHGDFNTNGVIDAGEPVFQGGVVIDGTLPAIGGVRNLNVPGDEDGAANGQLRIELFYPGAEKGLAVIAGKYLIRVSDPASGFAPVTNSFEVKQKVVPQGVSGRITALGTGLPLTNAPVLLLPPDAEPVAGTLTDANGNYTLHSPPGNYMVLPLAPGFVGDFNGGATVSAGAFAMVNLALPAATRTISGRLKDSSSGLGLPGVFIQAESDSGQFVSAFSQSDGTYSLGVLAGNWMLEPSFGSLAQLGYLGWRDGANVSTASGNVGNFDLPADRATALIFGTVRNHLNNPVIGVGIWSDEQSQQYETSGITYPPNADYCVGVRPGSWWVGPDSDALIPLGYIGQGTSVTLSANQALRVDFGLLPVNARLIGRVVDNLGAPVGNIGISADDHQNVNSSVNTDDSGSFNIGVSGGTWYLQLSADDTRQRQLVGPQLQITLANGETRSNLVLVAQHPTAQISGYVRNTSATPLANVAVYGSATINGTNYTDYARTDAGGNYQFQAINGTWQVWLECYDLQSGGYTCANPAQTTVAGASTTVNFVVQPAAPLQITTPASLPNGTAGISYTSQLQASGGQTPYTWSLVSGGLPGGLTLNNNSGLISGMPSNTGTFQLTVRVADAAASTATRDVSIVIYSTLPNTIVLKSDAFCLAAGLGSGAPNADQFSRLDAGNVSGLSFQPAAVGAFSSLTPVPNGAPAGTQVINIPPGNGQNGFFKMTFVLPAGFQGIHLAGAANVDDYGRVFVNGNPLSSSMINNDSGRISQVGDTQFSTTNPGVFRVGTNDLIIADANSGSGPSAAAFFAVVSFQEVTTPRLSIVSTNAGSVVVSWPSPAEGFVLEQASQLLSVPQTNIWTSGGISYQTNTTEIRATVPLAPGNKYFRLRKP